MTPVELLPPSQATPDNPGWHELRRAGISASDIAAVLGLSPWDSPFSLYWKKVNGWTLEDAPHLDAGRRIEPVIADWFAGQHENFAVRPAGLYRHADREWQLATPDRLLCGPFLCGACDAGLPMGCVCHEMATLAVLECKHPYSWDGWGGPGTDDVPVYYRAQVLWQMDVLGVDEGYVAAYSRHEFRAYRIRRDERDLAVMRAAGERFMARLEAEDPPDIDGHTATLATLKRLHPSIDPDVPPADVPVEVAEGYRRARALKARADSLVGRYEARLRHAIGDGQKALCGGRLVASRSVYDRKPYEVGPATVDRLNPGRTARYA